MSTAPPARPRASRRRNGQATIADVAQAAGVSPMTVSRVVNGEASVRAATRDEVRAAIAALDYRPNTAARQLAGASPCRIALLYANPSAAYLSEFLVGSLAEASRADAPLLVERCAPDEAAAAIARRLTARGVHGVVLPPPLCDDPALRAALSDAGLATVLVATGAPPMDAMAVTIDDRAAAAEMTAHLASLGHRRIGFVTGDARQTASDLRLEGYRAALAQADLTFDPALVARGDFGYRSGLVAAAALLQLRRPPSAIFASNDDMAAGVVAAAHRRRLEVPRDLSVAGFDDTALATTIWPALTTIRQPVAEMAEAAVALLVAAIRQGAPTPARRVFAHTLIRRASAAPPA